MHRYRPRTPLRFTALATAAVIVVTLFTGLIASMPPDFRGPTHVTRSTAAPVEVAIVPARIEVVGVRSVDTADEVTSARPRS